MYQKIIQTILDESKKVSRIQLSNQQVNGVISTVQKLQNVTLQKVVETISPPKCTTCSETKKIIPIVKKDTETRRLPTKFVDFESTTQWL